MSPPHKSLRSGKDSNLGRAGPYGPYSFREGRLRGPCSIFHFWSLHSGGGHFLWADGSVRFVTYGAASVLPAHATRSGREPAAPVE